MGSAQSAQSARQNSTSREVITSNNPVIATSTPPDAIGPSPSLEVPAETEEGSVSQRRVGKRRSLMKFSPFPSPKKRHSVMGLRDEGREDSVHASPSRRRWRTFSGLMNRPGSTIPRSEAAVDDEPSFEGPDPSLREQTSTEKGKEREVPLTDQESAWPEPSESTAHEPSASSFNSSHLGAEGIDERGHVLSPDAMVQELRELQNTLSTSSDSQSNAPHAPLAGDSKNQAERPPTPIPTSAIESTPVPEGEGGDPVSGSNSALVEALSSWMSGRSRGENVEMPSGDVPLTSPLHSQNAGPPVQSQTPNTGASRLHDSTPFSTFPRNTGRTVNATGSIPSLTMPHGSRIGRSAAPAPAQQDRRTLPPAGTGTLVVVQGVVHTTDVRHDHAHSHAPSRSQPPSASTNPHPSSLSTPTLRTPSHLASRSLSRPSSPQPPSRRSRFSSLTNSLRQRSRPGTASSRPGIGPGGWSRNLLASSSPHHTGETTPEPSDNFPLSVDSSASDSENTSASMSSTDPSPQPPDAAAALSDSQAGVVNVIDGLPLPGQPRTDGEEAHPTDGPADAHAGGLDDDRNEEEGEAELSASSIEVLGTLLSVATAATAASLVTGTTDPLFSSGLAGPNSNIANRYAVSPTQGDSDAGLSPQPIQETGPSAPPETGGNNHTAEAAVNTRMRAAWENLRDRFSRSRGRRSAATASEVEGRDDPREQMLRDMARAFNTGLGLQSDEERERSAQGRHGGNDGPGAESAPIPDRASSHNETSRTEGDGPAIRELEGSGPGPEGSFERFLHNLQVDLRTALTEDYAARRARAQARDAHPAAGTSPSDASMETYTRNGPTQPPISSQPTTGSDDTLDEPTTSYRADTDSDLSSHPPLVPITPNTPRPATLDLPSLMGDGETLPGGQGIGNAPPQAHGITGQPGAGINWWRLYRFPLMQLAPHPSTLATGGVPATQPRPSPTENPATSQDVGAGPRSQTPPLPTNSDAAPTQDVVPVIVVGLQSVPVNRGGVHNAAHNPHNHHQHESPSPSPFETQSLNGVSDPSSELPTRERRWPLRAASRALGRMGRRGDVDSSADDGPIPPEERSDPAREGRQGGRTYLIFVIGGYYPPNHSIVTGADDMNSFEALWELAELLGQVKPPVASKEDIEKSGLEIIKASSLSEYEQAGKVASNTVERCLICLDDYECEDNLRLLSCRHIFHQQCVDKWLEQGRNNCPACRTKGVQTGDESTTQIPTPGNRD